MPAAWALAILRAVPWRIWAVCALMALAAVAIMAGIIVWAIVTGRISFNRPEAA